MPKFRAKDEASGKLVYKSKGDVTFSKMERDVDALLNDGKTVGLVVESQVGRKWERHVILRPALPPKGA